MAKRKPGTRTAKGRLSRSKLAVADIVMAMPTARAGGPSGLSHAALSQPKALIAIAESFGEFASMAFAGFVPRKGGDQ